MVKGGGQRLDPNKSATSPWKSKCLQCGLIATPRFTNVQRGSGCTVCKNAEKVGPRKIPEKKTSRL